MFFFFFWVGAYGVSDSTGLFFSREFGHRAVVVQRWHSFPPDPYYNWGRIFVQPVSQNMLDYVYIHKNVNFKCSKFIMIKLIAWVRYVNNMPRCKLSEDVQKNDHTKFFSLLQMILRLDRNNANPLQTSSEI